MTGEEMDYARLAPEAVVLAAAVLALLAGSFLPRTRQRLLGPLAVGALLTAAVVGAAQAGAPDTVFSGTFALDGLTALIRVVVPLATAAVLVLGARERRGSPREAETVSLLLLAALGALVLAGASDLLVLAVGTLLTTIPLVGLIGIERSRLAAEAAVKTYLQASLFGILLLGGAAILSGVGGGSDYAGLTTALPEAPRAAVAIGSVAVTAGLLLEVGAVPAHFWVPDAAQGGSRQVAAFLTTVPKVAALVALLRLVEAVRGAVGLPLVVAVVAAITMLLGTFAAFRQRDVRRLLGWSTVSQAGFLLLPVAAADAPSLAVYLTGYAVANLAAFAVVAALPGRAVLNDWRGAARAHPFLVAVLLVALLAFVGIPPTAVFLGKLATFSAAWSAGFGWLVGVAALASVASLYYCLRWITACFARPPRAAPTATRADPPAAAVALVLGAATLAFAAALPLLAGLPTG